MYLQNQLFSSESVTEGHPDKMADQIADAILDTILTQDPMARVAVEVILTTGLVFIFGEVSTNAIVDYSAIARKTIQKIGYNNDEVGFDYKTCSILTAIGKQSIEIAKAMQTSDESAIARSANNQNQTSIQNAVDLCAGDQGQMFGYACRETETFMPLSISLAHQLTARLDECRHKGILGFLRPDGKSQVTVEYKEGVVARISSVVISAQHSHEVHMEEFSSAIYEEVISKVIPSHLLDKRTDVYINPSGKFVQGGPMSDSGLTGRKIIVDTYGGHGAHGGGAFSGKDPSKIDRSASYMARYIAKNIVAAGLMDRCLVQLSYVIGRLDPVSLMIEDYGTLRVDGKKLKERVREIFPLRLSGIIKCLELQRPIYEETATYGHFGRSSHKSFTWEKLDKVHELKN